MPASIPIEPISLPLATNEHGVVLVGGTRVTLDTVVYAFRSGATAEEIVHRYPSLSLRDVYATITYYLENSRDVDAYLLTREACRAQVQRENETRFDPNGVRDRLMARLKRPAGPRDDGHDAYRAAGASPRCPCCGSAEAFCLSDCPSSF